MASSFNSSPREYNDNEFDDLDSNDFTDREYSDEGLSHKLKMISIELYVYSYRFSFPTLTMQLCL